MCSWGMMIAIIPEKNFSTRTTVIPARTHKESTLIALWIQIESGLYFQLQMSL